MYSNNKNVYTPFQKKHTVLSDHLNVASGSLTMFHIYTEKNGGAKSHFFA